jgi:hypothetical protein
MKKQRRGVKKKITFVEPFAEFEYLAFRGNER